MDTVEIAPSERFINVAETDFAAIYESKTVQNHKLELRDTDTETTWDYSLFADSGDEQKKGKTIWITDTNFLAKLEGYDAFGKCEHEIIKIQCPCEEQSIFPICTKCHRVFCSNKCLKYGKDNQSGQVKKNQPSTGVQSKTPSDNDQGSPPKYNTSNSVRHSAEMPNPNYPERWSGLSEADALDAFLYAPPPMPGFMPPRGPRHPVRQPWNYRNLNNSMRAAINNPVPQNPRRMCNNGPRPRSSSGFDQARFPIPQKPFHDQQARFPPPSMAQRPPLFNKMCNASADPSSGQQSMSNVPNQQIPMPNQNGQQIVSSLSRGVGRGGFSPTISKSSSNNADATTSTTTNAEDTPSAETYQGPELHVLRNSPRCLKYSDSPKPCSSKKVVHHQESPPEKRISFSRKPTTTAARNEKTEERPYSNTFKKHPSNNSKSFNLPEQGAHRILPIAEKPFVTFGVPMQVGYSFGDSLDDFYVWNGLGFLDNRNIQTIIDDVDDFPIIPKPIVGKYCIAKYTNPEVPQIDGWYRARIIDVQGEHVKVFFIDYGNEEIVHQESIGSLTSNLLGFRPSAIRLAIGDLEQFERCEDFLGSIFDEYVVDKWIRVTIYEEHASEIPENLPQKYPAVLEICSDGKWISIAEILQNKKLGRRAPLWKNVFKPQEYLSDDYPAFNAIHQEYEVIVTHVKTINDFYVTPKDLISKRTSIMNALNISEFSAYPIDKWLETNYVCIARRQGEWARAKITEMSKGGVVEIRFIDFGETTKVNMDQLKSIPLQLLSEPQIAYRCSLPVFSVSGHNPEPLLLIQTLIEKAHPVSLVVFALEMELSTHTVEIYFENKRYGLTALLLKEHKDSFIEIEGYEVDLDIRTKLSRKRRLVNPVLSSQNVILKSLETEVGKSWDAPVMSKKPAPGMQQTRG